MLKKTDYRCDPAPYIWQENMQKRLVDEAKMRQAAEAGGSGTQSDAERAEADPKGPKGQPKSKAKADKP